MACFGKDMGFAIEKLFLFTTQSFLYLSCRIQDDAKGTPTLPFIQYDNCLGTVQVYDQVGEHVF